MADLTVWLAISWPKNLASVNFFSLPTNVRTSVYKLTLAVPHPLYLFEDTGSRLGVFAPGKPRQWLAFAVLYVVNQFTFEEVGSTRHEGRSLRSFLQSISSNNSRYLSHLCIKFPALQRIGGQPEEIKLAEASLQNLERLRSECWNLKTLETLVYGIDSSDLFRGDLNDNHPFRGVLTEIDALLRGINCLDKLIVRFSSGSPSPSVEEFLQGLGWVVIPGVS
ncbi:hypothetical protein BJY00DRAFT_301546 [Aspergillus carlsbadensis]|nr:hypothetical protein BJY00DRAFT_301546 [Aspergillus carlsbadensis]